MRNFFGLTDEYIKSIYEQFFYMKYYSGWGIYELYHLPIGLRSFYIKMLIENKEKEKEAYENAQRR